MVLALGDAQPKGVTFAATAAAPVGYEQDVAQLFAALDENGNGTIGRDELTMALATGLIHGGRQGLDGTVEMSGMEGACALVPITCEPGVDLSKVVDSPIFMEWVADVRAQPIPIKARIMISKEKIMISKGTIMVSKGTIMISKGKS